MRKFFHWLFHPNVEGSSWILLVRIFAGLVFIGEGILKFIYPSLGVILFAQIGFPFPDVIAGSIGILEIVGGLFLILGLFNNLFALIFAIEMVIAFLLTKISIFLGTSPLPLSSDLPQMGFWTFIHEARVDFTQFFAMTFLLILGPGKLSLDALFFKNKDSR